MNTWALIFITFTKLQTDVFSFEAIKNPYNLKSKQECLELIKEIKQQTVNPTWEAICVEIKQNTN